MKTARSPRRATWPGWPWRCCAIIRTITSNLRRRSFSWRGRRYANHNPLLSSYEGADGIKTGYIRQSGYNLVGSAERDGQRVIAVVLGSKTPGIRDWTITTLLDYGFEQIAGNPTIKTSRRPALYLQPDGRQGVDDRHPKSRRSKRNSYRARPAGPRARSTSREDPADSVARTAREWAVQVGAYPSTPPAENAALEAKAKIPDLLGDTRLSLSPDERRIAVLPGPAGWVDRKRGDVPPAASWPAMRCHASRSARMVCSVAAASTDS